MKTKIIYGFAICSIVLLVQSCASQKSTQTNPTVARLVGLWEVKAEHRSDEKGYKRMPHGMFKLILPNGKFVNFMTTDRGSTITLDGTYVVEGDSTYIEKIDHSFNKSQIGMANPLYLKLSNDNFMYLRWFQAIDEFNQQQNRWIEEIWQRVKREGMNRSTFSLQQELRTILEDQEVIDYIIQ